VAPDPLLVDVPLVDPLLVDPLLVDPALARLLVGDAVPADRAPALVAVEGTAVVDAEPDRGLPAEVPEAPDPLRAAAGRERGAGGRRAVTGSHLHAATVIAGTPWTTRTPKTTLASEFP
jgi:hypothetical protein